MDDTLRSSFSAKELSVLAGGAFACAAAAGASAGALSAMLVPFAAAFVLAVTGQAVAWLALLVLVSGVSLYWTTLTVDLAGKAINLSGLQWGSTFLLAGMLVVFLPAHARRLPRFFLAYGVFVLLAAAGIVIAGNRFEALKQTLLYATPLAVGLLVVRVADGEREIRVLRAAVWGALLISAAIGVASLAWSEVSGAVTAGLRGAIGSRTFAIFLIVPYALALANWRTRSPAYLLIVLGVLLLIGLTLSRTVLAVALLLFALTASLGASPVKKLVAAVILVVAGFGVLQIDAVRGRMLQEDARGRPLSVSVSGEGRDRQLAVGPIDLTGRGVYWFQTFRHGLERPFTGHGTGSASVYLRDVLQFPIAHPHNDYLRVFHDSGLIGLAALGAFALAGLTGAYRLYRRATNVLARELALAAWLAWVAYLLIAVTDNVMIYASFFTVNLFLLFGAAYVAGSGSGSGRGAEGEAEAGWAGARA